MSKRFVTQIESDVPNGTAPIIVDSSTLVANLNADLLDGQHGSYYAPIASPTFTGTSTFPTLSLTTADTTTAASHYIVETASDGIIRPKTLANVRVEIVTTAAVNSASATVLGTVTSGVWQGSSISTTYTDAKVTSVNGSTGAITVAAINQTMHIGTTAIAINRASASLSLTGITSIDGSAATLTTSRNIGDVSFNGSANIVPERILYKDTRSTNYNPFTYIGATLHLKTNTTDSLSDGGTFHGVLDLAHWSDSSGGVNHQIGLTDNGNAFLRYSTGASTWSSWRQFAYLDSPTFTGTVTAATLDLTTAATSTVATSYWVETGSDGVLRPKTLANARTEIVTTAAVNAAAATTVGTVTSGVWNAGAITTSSIITGNGGIAAEAWTKDDITTRTQSGFIQTATATTGEGWPETTNNWYHLLSSTHSNTTNYYSLQLAAPFFSNKLYFRSTNGSGTTAWSQIATVDQIGSGGLDPFFLGGM